MIMHYIPIIVLMDYTCTSEIDAEVYFKSYKLLKKKSMNWLIKDSQEQAPMQVKNQNLLNVQNTNMNIESYVIKSQIECRQGKALISTKGQG